MIHNHLKFTSLLLVSSWLSVRVLYWRLSQPGFDPTYGNLVCLATLMRSVRTKQICLWMTIYIWFINKMFPGKILNKPQVICLPTVSDSKYSYLTRIISINNFFCAQFEWLQVFLCDTNNFLFCPVNWGCGIYRLLLCRGVTPPNECPECDTKETDDSVPVILGLWGMWSTPSLPLLPGPLWPGVVTPDRALSIG